MRFQPEALGGRIHPLRDATHDNDDRLPPEVKAHILAAMDQMQPFEVTDAEWTAWETDRQARK